MKQKFSKNHEDLFRITFTWRLSQIIEGVPVPDLWEFEFCKLPFTRLHHLDAPLISSRWCLLWTKVIDLVAHFCVCNKFIRSWLLWRFFYMFSTCYGLWGDYGVEYTCIRKGAGLKDGDVYAQHENSERCVSDGAGHLVQYVREIADMANIYMAYFVSSSRTQASWEHWWKKGSHRPVVV